MIDLYELLGEVESTDTLRTSVEKLVDGVIDVVRASNPALGDKLGAMRLAFANAVTSNTAHVAVRIPSATRVEALARVVNSPEVDHAERVVLLEAEVGTLTGERDATALLLLGANKDRDELREALKAVQDELYAAQAKVVAVQQAYEQQVARTAAAMQAQATQITALHETAKEAKDAAQLAVAAAETALKAREPASPVEAAKE